MENLKIRVNSEAESKEAQELFFELGYEKEVFFKSDYPRFVITKFIDGRHISTGCDLDVNSSLNKKEITLPQLRDMVILKRNDPKDATHTDQDDWKCYIGADSYVWQVGNSQQLKQWDQSSLAMVDLKPIEKEMKEYLDKEYRIRKVKQTNGDNLVPSGWIEVPQGAEILTAILGDEVFYKSGEPWEWYCEESKKWMECSDIVGLDGFQDILWHRKKESLNDKVASAEEYKKSVQQGISEAENGYLIQHSDVKKIMKDKIDKLKHSHYKKDVSHLKSIDVYRVLDLFGVDSHEVGHAIKKLLCSGQRGAKDHKQDIQEAIDSLNRHLEMLAEDEAS